MNSRTLINTYFLYVDLIFPYFLQCVIFYLKMTIWESYIFSIKYNITYKYPISLII